jgi:hypothetical protein
MRHAFVLILLAFIAYFPLYGQSEETAPETETVEDYDDYDYTDNEESFLPAVDPATLPTTRDYQSKNLTVRKFDNDKWKKVIGSADYDNVKGKKDKAKKNNQGQSEEKESGKKRFGDDDDYEEEDSSNLSFNLGPGAGLVAQLVFYGVIIAIIAILIFMIIKNVSRPGNRKIETSEAEISTQVEDINDLDLDSLLLKTLAAGNHRLAIRLYFLGLLKKLNETGLIVWKKDKTNRDYLTELFPKEQYFEDVRKLTLAYEEVWYGDHSLPTELYHQLSDEFKAIDQRLNASRVQ